MAKCESSWFEVEGEQRRPVLSTERLRWSVGSQWRERWMAGERESTLNTRRFVDGIQLGRRSAPVSDTRPISKRRVRKITFPVRSGAASLCRNLLRRVAIPLQGSRGCWKSGESSSLGRRGQRAPRGVARRASNSTVQRPAVDIHLYASSLIAAI